MYRRKFRERLGELTPRNLDHPVPVGLVDIGGRRALIYGHPWRGLSSHPVPVLHPTDCKGTANTGDWPKGACGRSSLLPMFPQMLFLFNRHMFCLMKTIWRFTASHLANIFHYIVIKLPWLCTKNAMQNKDYIWATMETDTADILSLLMIKTSYCNPGLPLALFTRSWTVHHQRTIVWLYQ